MSILCLPERDRVWCETVSLTPNLKISPHNRDVLLFSASAACLFQSGISDRICGGPTQPPPPQKNRYLKPKLTVIQRGVGGVSFLIQKINDVNDIIQFANEKVPCWLSVCKGLKENKRPLHGSVCTEGPGKSSTLCSINPEAPQSWLISPLFFMFYDFPQSNNCFAVIKTH